MEKNKYLLQLIKYINENRILYASLFVVDSYTNKIQNSEHLYGFCFKIHAHKTNT